MSRESALQIKRACNKPEVDLQLFREADKLQILLGSHQNLSTRASPQEHNTGTMPL